MIRGTTPELVFELPYDASSVKDLRITFEQRCFKLVKKLADVAVEGHTIKVKLTQKETLKFKAGEAIKWDIKVIFIDGNVVPSDIYEMPCYDTLNDEVLS